MLLIGYLYDIRSERRLAEEMSLNLAYRWYIGYDLDEEVPDHSIFSKARKRFGRKLFLEVFNHILKQCLKADLVKGDSLFVDSTLVKANASMNSLVEVKLSPEVYWRELESSEEAKRSYRRHSKEKMSQQVGTHFTGKMDLKKVGRRRRDRRVSYLNKRSTTDPDATVHYRPGIGASLSYKAHLATEESGVITAVAVSSSAVHDTNMLPELLARHRRHLGNPHLIVGDSHYGSFEALSYLQGQGIKTAIPPIGPRNRPHHYPKTLFHYDKEQDLFICPRGKKLPRRCKNHRTNQIIYRAKKEECNICPDRNRCIDSARAIARQVTRYDGDQIERAQTLYDSALGKELMKKRKTAIEGTFAQAKSFHGLRRAKFRGKEKMEIQLLLTAAAINLKKLLARARALSLDTTRTLRNVYDFLSHSLFGYCSNSCLRYKLLA
jgi:IS5 family transposase